MPGLLPKFSYIDTSEFRRPPAEFRLREETYRASRLSTNLTQRRRSSIPWVLLLHRFARFLIAIAGSTSVLVLLPDRELHAVNADTS